MKMNVIKTGWRLELESSVSYHKTIFNMIHHVIHNVWQKQLRGRKKF